MPFDINRVGMLVISALVGTTLVIATCHIFWRLLQWKRLLRRQIITFELTPPSNISRSPIATQELFTVVHGFRTNRSILQKLLQQDVMLSFEIASSQAEGIRYIVQADRRLAAGLRAAITSYLPQIKITEVNDTSASGMQVIEFAQSSHFAFPLLEVDSLDQHDPVAYLAGAMTQLKRDEQMRLQLVIAPVKLKEATLLARRILGNEDLLTQLSSKTRFPFVLGAAQLVSNALFAITDMAGAAYHGPVSGSHYGSSGRSSREAYEQRQIANHKRPTRTLSTFESELMETMHRKLNQPLFRVNIRVGVRTGSVDTERDRLSAIKSSLQAYQVPSYQSLRARMNLPLVSTIRRFAFQKRLPSLFPKGSIVLSSSELASLYHFPTNVTSRPDNLITSLSRTLAAPVSLKQNGALDVVLGRNVHHGERTLIGLTTAERERHVYIVGGTGNGKTTMLEYAIIQDIQNGKGVAVVDPHGDLAKHLLRYIPENRIQDVIYFNPSDLSYPIGLNLLELPEGLKGDELLDAKDFVTEAVISVMRKVFSEDDSGGHRIEYVLRNATQTALTIKDATLFTIFDLLTDSKYRKKVAKSLENEKLRNFWLNEFGRAGDFQRVKMAGGVTAKIGRFQFSASAERILSQPKSTINFEEILDGKILICNFAKGLIGEDTSELFGIATLAKLQLAAYRRAKTDQKDRKPFYLYVDEFQNFATMSFVQMLSEARKYKLFLTMAEQSTSQQDDVRMVNTILANVGTVIAFRSGNPADEHMLLPLFKPYISEGELANLPTYNFYARLAGVLPQEPMSGETILLDDNGSKIVADAAVEASRSTYANKYFKYKYSLLGGEDLEIRPRAQSSKKPRG